MGSLRTGSLASIAAIALFVGVAADAQPAPKGPSAWRGCCGLPPWAASGPMPSPRGEQSLLFSGYGSLVPGSAVRHHMGLSGAIPAPYAKLSNPLAPTPANAQRGAAVYDAQCASCHGAAGLGDGPAARGLVPPPAHLGWLAKVQTSRLDPFMYWSVAEGGRPLGTAMPAFKGKLTDEEIWSVIGYIQARLPKAAAPAR